MQNFNTCQEIFTEISLFLGGPGAAYGSAFWKKYTIGCSMKVRKSRQVLGPGDPRSINKCAAHEKPPGVGMNLTHPIRE